VGQNLPTIIGDDLRGRGEAARAGIAVPVVQGMTLPVLMRWLRLSEHPSVADAERQARLEQARAVAVDAAETALDMRRDLIAFQRDTLAGLRQQGRIGTTTLRAIEHDLDLEEARLPGI
jgi:hypothetical protein